MKKYILLSSAALTILAAGMVVTNTVSAQTMNGRGHMGNLVQKISEKFGLNQADVQSVFDQERADQQDKMQANFDERLTQAVTNGKITEDQKQMVIAKHKEMVASRQADLEALKGKTPDEVRTFMQENREKRQEERKALEDWAKQNGIDFSFFAGEGRGMGMGMRGGHMMGRGERGNK